MDEVLEFLRRSFRTRNNASSIAASSVSSAYSIRVSTASTIHGGYPLDPQMNAGEVERIRQQLMKELKEEGKLIDTDGSTLKPMDEDRRKRKIDSILENTKDK